MSTAACRACGNPIAFRLLPSGRYQPLDPETGEVHFSTCPARLRPQLPTDTCLRCGSSDIRREAGTGQHYAAIRCIACGAHRWLPKPR